MKNSRRKAAIIILFLFGTMDAGSQERLKSHSPFLYDTLRKVPPVFRKEFKPLPVKYNYYQSLGAACKVELRLERATKVPLRFRLGSLQHTDYLEQKPNSSKP